MSRTPAFYMSLVIHMHSNNLMALGNVMVVALELVLVGVRECLARIVFLKEPS